MEIWKRNLAARARRLGIKRNVKRRRLTTSPPHHRLMSMKINSGLAYLFMHLAERAAFEGNVDAFKFYEDTFNAHRIVMPRTREKVAKCRARILSSGIQIEMRNASVAKPSRPGDNAAT